MSIIPDPTPIPCCVCHATEWRPWRTAGDNLLGSDTVYQAVRCARCGTRRLDPRPAGDWGRFYPPETYARAEEPDSAIGERLDTYNGQLAERADRLRPVEIGLESPRVLDVGCGDGRFLRAMQGLGWQGAGTETDPVAAQLAQNRIGNDAPIYPQTLDALPPDAGRFHMVSLLHVLEHVPDPRQTLTDAYRLLLPNGVLFIALPNAGSLEAALFGTAWYHLDLPRHLWGFTPHTLNRLLEETGFQPVSRRYLPLLFVPQSVRNVLQRGGKPSPHVPPPPTAPPGGRGRGARGRGGRLYTHLFNTLLAAGTRLGETVPGEVMEVAARRLPNA